MSYTAQRLAESLSGSFNNIGGALLDVMAKKRQQANADREHGFREKVHTDNLASDAATREQAAEHFSRTYGLQRDEALGRRADQGWIPTAPGQSMSGFDANPATAEREPVPQVVDNGRFTAANQGGALLEILGQRLAYNPGMDRARQSDERRAAESARELTSRENLTREGHGVQREVANIYADAQRAGREASVDDDAVESGAKYQATRLIEAYGGDAEAVIADLKDAPPTRENQAMLREVQNVAAQRRTRSILGIGDEATGNWEDLTTKYNPR